MRRSTRLKNNDQSKIDPVQGSEQSEDVHGRVAAAEEKKYVPPKPRQRKTARTAAATSTKGGRRTNPARRVAKLCDLPGLPLDILFYIFKDLHPLDLLHISRTTKAFRNMLLQRSAKSIWKNALTSIEGLPECPFDMNEPQYARLAFDATCFFCGGNVKTILWALRIRCCKRCRPGHLVDAHELLDLISPEVRRKTYGWIGLLQKSLPFHIPETQAGYIWYRRESVIQFEAELRRLIDDDDHLKAFCEEKEIQKASIKEHAEKCEIWHAILLQSRADELAAARVRRRDSIYGRLRDAGWGETMDNMSYDSEEEFENNAFIRQPKDLTDRIWRNIKDELVKYLQVTRQEHLLRMVHWLRREFRETCPKDMAVPPVADLCLIEEFKTIFDLPPCVQVSEATFDPAMQRLPELCARWTQSANERLVALLPSDENGARPDAEKLKLATSIFRCKHCGNLKLDPIRVLNHHCTGVHSQLYCDAQLAAPEFIPLRTEQPWHIETDFEFSPCASAAIGKVLTLCGKDPRTTTWAEMNRLDPRFQCGPTTQGNAQVRTILTWRGAFDHELPSPRRQCIGELKLLLEGPELSEIMETELIRFEGGNMWCCAICDAPLASADLPSHLLHEHEVADVEKKHYYQNPYGPAPEKWVSRKSTAG